MRSTLTISLPEELRRDLTARAKSKKMSQSEFVRQAVQEKLWEDTVEESARRLTPKARARGLLTDEDVFAEFS